MGIIFGVIIFILVVIVAIIAIGAWLVVKIVGGIGYLFAGPRRVQPIPQTTRVYHSVQCGSLKCGAMNPTPARFCRRCGGTMMGIQSRQSLKVA